LNEGLGFRSIVWGIVKLYWLFFFFLYVPNRHDRAKAVDILVKDLKVFSTFNEELYKEITQLLTLENFRFVHFAISIHGIRLLRTN